ncbi:MAG TPA: hypothetical protein VGM69_20355 [Chloroflexota bacterium]
MPPGLFFDVAANLFDARDVLEGARPLWFARNNGREPLVIYLEAAAALIWGPTPLAAKAATAAIGIATIPAMYLLGREVGQALGRTTGRAERVGLLAAFLTATLYWHLNFSRIGLRTIALPLFLALGIGLLLRALRRGTLGSALLGGLATGGAVYTYTSARLAPLFLLPALVGLWLAWPARWRQLGVFVAAAAVAVAPLAIYYVDHRGEVEGRTASVSVLNEQVAGGDPLGAALRGLAATAAATVWRGTESGMENLPGRPLFEPVTGAGFLLGCGLALVALARAGMPRALGLTLLAWLATMMLPSALSVNPPGFSRITGMIPVAVVLAALGLERFFGWAGAVLRRPWALRALAAATLAVPLLWTSYDYFVVWAPSDVAYRWMMEDKVQAARRVESWLDRGERVFLAPLYARDYTFSFLLRDAPVESFDLGATLVVPGDGRRARYAFPPDDREGLATVAERLGAPAEVEVVADESGRFPLLATLALDPPPAETGPPLARFEDGIELLDVEPRAGRARPGGTLTLRLSWRAPGAARPSRDYTVFVHGRDGAGTTRFQRDRMPGDGGVPTSRWRPGDLVHDFLPLALPADLAAGQYRLVVGLYHQPSGARLSVVDRTERPNELEVTRLTVGP